MVEYHSSDFELDAWREEASKLYQLPPLSEWVLPVEFPEPHNVHDGVNDYSEKWDSFYGKHNSGDFFKPRRYLTVEFEKFLSKCEAGSTVLEVGCGHGCSMFPIIKTFPVQYIATDYSEEVLFILKGVDGYDSSRCSVERWDVTLPPPLLVTKCIQSPLRAIVSVFALSAVHPDLHIQSFVHMRDLLVRYCSGGSNTATSQTSSGDDSAGDIAQPGIILVRDYGVHDMTMYRHRRRYSDTLFGRADGTLAYYFDLAYLRGAAEAAGLTVLELEYATVRTENRKKGSVMHRVFVHAVFGIPPVSVRA
jgi:SAM-dependent methyltransferase